MVIDHRPGAETSGESGASKYRRLYEHLCSLGLERQEWRTNFKKIEKILGERLPESARKHRQWWENPEDPNGRSQALAWTAAGWMTKDVDMKAETLLFVRRNTSTQE